MRMAAYPLLSVIVTPRTSYQQVKMNTVSTGRYLGCNHKRPNNGIMRAQLVDFAATRKVDIPFKQGTEAGEEYIKEIERVVSVTFPDSSRIRYVGCNVWRARLRPVTFSSITATPFCDVEVFHKEKTLHISSNKLILGFIGIPGQHENVDLNFSLQGELFVEKKPPLVAQNEQAPSFKGWAKMGLKVDLPLPFSLMPNSIIVPIGNGILDRILGAMEGALVSRIIGDYNSWCQKVSNQQSTTIL